MDQSNPYASPYSVAQSPEDVRTEFYQKTYLHLAGAIAAFILVEMAFFSIPGIENTVFGLLQGKFAWFAVLGLFMGASWIANKWAMSNSSRGMQYAGLGLFIVAQAIVFLPLLLIAKSYSGSESLIGQAAIITLGLLAGLTFVAFTTKKDFSFLGGMLKIGGFIAMGLIAASIFMGFNLGIWFSGAMVLFAGGSILHQTSNMIHHHRSDQYVAASLGLFASVALLFYYILQMLLSLTSND